MSTVHRSYTRALCVVAGVALCTALALASAHSPTARAASAGQLRQEINVGQGHLSSLAGQLGAAASHVAHLNSSIAGLEGQIGRIEADLDAKLAALGHTRTELKAARKRLAQLEADQARDEVVLAKQLVNRYESDRPDIVSVVLNSTGFQDLLEQISFASRIQLQNVQVVKRVKAIRRAVAGQAVHLGALEVREQSLTDQIRSRRNELVNTKVSLVQQRLAAARDRDAKASRLESARSQVASLQQQLSSLEAAQAAAAARAARATAARAAAARASANAAPAPSSSGGTSPAPSAPAPSRGSGGFVFPLPKSAAVSPSAWSPDDGVDISAPGNTPEYAVCSGTIVLHGIGGFGPWAPVLHCDSPVGGYSYVYYGHAGPANQLPVGTHVSAGEVMSSVGPGDVGISTGPHIEIGFCSASGNPLGPGTAGTMMSLLQSSY